MNVFVAIAQDDVNFIDDKMKDDYLLASPNEKLRLDSINSIFVEQFKKRQVSGFGNVLFGMVKEDVLPMLKNKFGNPSDSDFGNSIDFKNIRYAGFSFDKAYFNFQSDGIKSYLNGCVLLKTAKSKQEVETIQSNLKMTLSKKYNDLVEGTDEKGFKLYSGGISPLWDGNLYNLSLDDFAAVRIDAIEYTRDVVEVFGYRYAVRIVYGPYNYVKEEF